MPAKPEHLYHTQITWTGNKGEGTKDYKSYERSHTLAIENKKDILCSSDPYFRGDASKHNPEEFLVAAISSCHMLWYLHLCADNGINIISYTDHAVGKMHEKETGGGFFTEVTLYPEVVITNSAQIGLANTLHKKAGEKCFITNSCNFPVSYEPVCTSQ